MSFLNAIFGGGQPDQQQQQPANQQQQPNQQSGAGQPGNIPPTAEQSTNSKTGAGTDPNGVIPAGTGDETSPLAEFADLWKTDPNAAADPSENFSFNVDPQKLFAAAGKTDFSKALSPEVMQKIAAGGEEATIAMKQAFNSIAQATYGQSTLATTKIVEQALAAQQERFQKLLPQIIKQQNVSDSLVNENPLWSNPAVQPVMEALKAQLAVKYPNATAAQLTASAKKYVEALGSVSAPKQQPGAKGANESNDVDWSTFLQ